MKCILLAAGYATRLYPLTENKPKALLDVAGKLMIDRIMEKILEISAVDEVIVVTNERFYEQFSNWAGTYACPVPIKVLNDHTTSNDNRLGAIADITFVMDSCHITDEIFVLASDNLFDFNLSDMYNMYQKKQGDCVCAREVADMDTLRRVGVAEIDSVGRVLSFVEKPAEPKSNLAVIAAYMYRKETLAKIRQYIAEGNNPDAPGNLIPWLITKTDVYAYTFQGVWFDVGTHESYQEVIELYKERESV